MARSEHGLAAVAAGGLLLGGLALLMLASGDDDEEDTPMGDRPPTAAELLESLPALAENRWPENLMLAAADRALRVPELLERLRAQGWRPRLAYTWRSLSSQAHLFAAGATRVTFSFHNAVDDAGFPAGQAADVFDTRYGWGDEAGAGRPRTDGAAAFFKALGTAAEQLGLHWGGRWDRDNATWAAYGLGWDPGHVQLQPNSALADVRRKSLPAILGAGVLKEGSGGYRYRQWPNGWVQIAASPNRDVGELVFPVGRTRGAWRAITEEIGAPGGV